MSNIVTTSIREFIRDMAIGRTKTTDRADRATVEKVQDNIYSLFSFGFSLVISSFYFIGFNDCVSPGLRFQNQVYYIQIDGP